MFSVSLTRDEIIDTAMNEIYVCLIPKKKSFQSRILLRETQESAPKY